jgi:hypothetical protein
MLCCQKGVYLISLFIGKLGIGSHECSFYLVVEEAPILPQLASFFDH